MYRLKVVTRRRPVSAKRKGEKEKILEAIKLAETIKLVEKWHASLTEWEFSKVLRILMRIRNHDPKVARLWSKVESGELSRQHFLELM